MLVFVFGRQREEQRGRAPKCKKLKPGSGNTLRDSPVSGKDSTNWAITLSPGVCIGRKLQFGAGARNGTKACWCGTQCFKYQANSPLPVLLFKKKKMLKENLDIVHSVWTIYYRLQKQAKLIYNVRSQDSDYLWDIKRREAGSASVTLVIFSLSTWVLVTWRCSPGGNPSSCTHICAFPIFLLSFYRKGLKDYRSKS